MDFELEAYSQSAGFNGDFSQPFVTVDSMAPTTPRKSVPKDRFPTLFATLKTQTYYDPSTRGPGSHTFVTPTPHSTINVLTTHQSSSIRTIAWNPTGHLIATGSVDRTLRIWNPEKPQVKNSTELRGHTGAIERVAWNPTKEAELGSVSSDGTCRFWDVRSKTCTATVPLGGEGLTIGWASDGSLALAGRKVTYSLGRITSNRSCYHERTDPRPG